jgi:hypothetical protein
MPEIPNLNPLRRKRPKIAHQIASKTSTTRSQPRKEQGKPPPKPSRHYLPQEFTLIFFFSEISAFSSTSDRLRKRKNMRGSAILGPIMMSNPNQYGSQGGSSSRSNPDNRGKGSADQEILDGLLPRIETRGQSSRSRHKKGKDGKKEGSSRKLVTSLAGLRGEEADAVTVKVVGSMSPHFAFKGIFSVVDPSGGFGGGY